MARKAATKPARNYKVTAIPAGSFKVTAIPAGNFNRTQTPGTTGSYTKTATPVSKPDPDTVKSAARRTAGRTVTRRTTK